MSPTGDHTHPTELVQDDPIHPHAHLPTTRDRPPQSVRMSHWT